MVNLAFTLQTKDNNGIVIMSKKWTVYANTNKYRTSLKTIWLKP